MRGGRKNKIRRTTTISRGWLVTIVNKNDVTKRDKLIHQWVHSPRESDLYKIQRYIVTSQIRNATPDSNN